MRRNKTDDNIIANDFVNVIKELINQETSKLDTTIVCRVVEDFKDGTFSVYVEPDESTIVKGITSIANTSIKAGDYVYVYKVKNQLNNAFIIKKISKQSENLDTSIKYLEQSIGDLKSTIEVINQNLKKVEQVKISASMMYEEL